MSYNSPFYQRKEMTVIQKTISWPIEWASIPSDTYQTDENRQFALQLIPALSRRECEKEISDQERTIFLKSHSNAERCIIEVTNKIGLDSIIIWASNKGMFTEKPWIIYCSANEELYEDGLDFFDWMNRETGCNVLSFNYRGVGRSGGFPLCSGDIVFDTAIVFDFLRSHNVMINNILIYGRSLGAAPATIVRALHPNGPICSERSFSNLTSLSIKILGENSAKAQKAGWYFNVLEPWKQICGYKWVLVSPTDEVIDYKTASLYKALKKKERGKTIKLPKVFSSIDSQQPLGHNIPLRSRLFTTLLKEHLQHLQLCFNKSNKLGMFKRFIISQIKSMRSS